MSLTLPWLLCVPDILITLARLVHRAGEKLWNSRSCESRLNSRCISRFPSTSLTLWWREKEATSLNFISLITDECGTGMSTPKFSQIYIFLTRDTDAELNYRLTHTELDPHILQELQSKLRSVDSYVKFFKTVIEVGVEQSDVKLVLHADKKTSSRQSCANLQLTNLQRSCCSFTRWCHRNFRHYFEM